MNVFKISEQVINLIVNAIENCKSELIAGQTLAEVKIQSDIFQEDSPQLFVIAGKDKLFYVYRWYLEFCQKLKRT